MLGKISKRTVEAIVPGPRDVFLWDTETKGFGVKVTSKGRRVYLLQYRTGGREKPTMRYTIGKHGDLTADQARKEAIRLLGQVADGGDPAKAKSEKRKGETVSDLIDAFIEQHVDVKLKPRTAKEYMRFLEKFLRPALGKKKIVDVERADISRLHHSRRATPRDANFMVAVASKMFIQAEKWGYRPDGFNPCRNIERYPEKTVDRFLSGEELERLGKALASAETEGVSPYALAVFRVLLFTGARLSEITGLRWEDVDLEGAALNLPDSKTGKKTVHLPAPAVEVLAAVPKYEQSPFVFPGEKDGRAISNIHKYWYGIRKKAGLDDLRIHDLRHGFASVAAASGLSLPIIGALLGHTQAQTTQRYAHLAADPLKEAAGMIGERIAAAMKGERADVLPFDKGKRRRGKRKR